MGRKGKPPAERLSEVIRVLVTKEQKAKLDRYARRNGKELSTWLREIALEAAGIR